MIEKNKVTKILQMAKFSKWAYGPEDEIKKILQPLGYEVIFLEKNETQLFIAKSYNEVVVCFRGTEPDKIVDISTDLKCKQVPWMYGKVHQGFYEALVPVENQLFDHFIKHDPSKKITITGHSLGGALASLFALSLKCKLQTLSVEVVTFGAPKIGNEEFVVAYEKHLFEKTTRVVNDEDVVPLVPTHLFMDYSQSDDLYFLNDDSELTKAPKLFPVIKNGVDLAKEMIEAEKRLSQDPEAVKKMLESNAKELCTDHLIDAYIEGLEKALSKMTAKNVKTDLTL